MIIKGSQVLKYFAIKYKGDWDRILEALKNKEDLNDDEVINTINSLKCKAVTYMDPEYPEVLRQIYKPPFVLFYYGDYSLLENYRRLLAVVGAREPSEYGKTHLDSIVKDVSKDYVIVSGLAIGIDTLAHETCINSGGKTIAVLGCGIDYNYPERNKPLQDEIKNNHLLISEYPDFTPPVAQNFVFRNRLVVGLSKGALVFDCKEASGTLSSANLACNLNKDLMSIPYPVGSGFYNNHLISDGADLVETGNDVRQVMNSY